MLCLAEVRGGLVTDASHDSSQRAVAIGGDRGDAAVAAKAVRASGARLDETCHLVGTQAQIANWRIPNAHL